MAFIPGYDHDIFISFAHDDNDSIPGQANGRIEQFYKNLNLMLARRVGRLDTVKIWWDNKKQDDGILNDQSAESAIQRSAIMICLNSAGYAASDHCKKELDTFYKKALAGKTGLKVGGHSRIIHVLLDDISFDKWPAELKATSVFQFNNKKDTADPGDTVDAFSSAFKMEMQKLVSAVWQLLNDFLKEQTQGTVEQPVIAGKNKEALTIYMGEVADPLRIPRNRVISELRSKGFNVLTSAIPDGSAPDGNEDATNDALKNADLVINLLDEYPGREITGHPDKWSLQKQTELILKSGKPQMIWVPAETDFENIKEEGYKQFLQSIEKGSASVKEYEFVRGNKSTLTHDIIDFAELVKVQQKQKRAAKGNVSVMLDTHYSDQLYAVDLARVLLDNKIQPFINPQEDDPGKNIHLMGERLSQANKLIFFYGKVSKEWLRERMNAALELIITNNYPIKEFFIYMVPPFKESNNIFVNQQFLKVHVINNSKNGIMNKNELQDFLKALNTPTA